MKVLMVGASGEYASMVVPELKSRGAIVRALVRSTEKEAEAREHGADETAVGDLTDSASLRRAAEGVEGVFHINPALHHTRPNSAWPWCRPRRVPGFANSPFPA